MNADDDLSTGARLRATATVRERRHDLDGRRARRPELRASRTARSAAPGCDILIGNTGGDRLIDWVGEFNSYIVPFAPFGIATVSRQVPTRAVRVPLRAVEGAGRRPDACGRRGPASDPARNGEPYGEAGIVTQKDHGLWQQQTGSPTDPQAGNIPGGRRDVLRSANFNDGTTAGFAPDSGVWQVTSGTLQVSAASQGMDADAVIYLDQTLPTYYELLASVIDSEADGRLERERLRDLRLLLADRLQVRRNRRRQNKVVVGHRNAQGWFVDQTGRRQRQRVVANTWYDLEVVVNGLVVTRARQRCAEAPVPVRARA